MIQNVGNNKYKITIECGFVNGKRKRVSRTINGSKKEAKIREAELLEQVKEKSHLYNEPNKKLTFSELASLFIENYCKNNLKENTTHGYQTLLKVILEEIGSTEVDSITPYVLQCFYTKIRDKYNYSSNTIRHYYVLINNIFERGRKWQLIENNPNSILDKPKLEKKEAKIYDYNQVTDLMQALEKEEIQYKTPIVLCVDTGMRREELNALKWENINFETKEISIKEVRIAVGKKIITTSPKTFNSKRTIVASDVAIDSLKKLKQYQDNIKNSLGENWNKNGYVFVNEDGNPYYPDTLSKIFKRIQKKHGLDDLTLHQLRHTSASLLINSNEDVKSVSVRLGHA